MVGVGTIEFKPGGVDISSSAPRPLVLHLAHFQPKRKHILRYQHMFQDLGCDVLTCCTFSPVDVFIPSRGLGFGEKILDFVLDLGRDKPALPKVIISTFSGASKTVYWPILALLRRTEKYSAIRNRVVGQMFDSCPIDFRADEGLGFFSEYALKGGSSRYSLIKPISDYVLYPCLKAFSIGLDTVMRKEIERQHFQYWDDITKPPFDAGVRTLVLFSRKDRIVNYKTVLKFCDAMSTRNGGKTFESVEFQRSQHVNHIVEEPETYYSSVNNFVKKSCSVLQSKL